MDMSRRPIQPRSGMIGQRANRMALGGRLASESRIKRFWHPVGVVGEASANVICINVRTQFAWTGNWTSGVADPPQYTYFVYDYDWPGVPDPPLCCGIPPYGWNPPPPPPPSGTTQVTLTITVWAAAYLFTESSFVISCKPGHTQTVAGGPWAPDDIIEVVIPMDWEYLRFPRSGISSAPAWPNGDLLICPAPAV